MFSNLCITDGEKSRRKKYNSHKKRLYSATFMIIYYFSKCIALELMRKKLWSFLFIYMSGKSTPWNFEHFFKITERKKEILIRLGN